MSDPVTVKKTSPWLEAVAAYRAANGCTYREAMKGAAETFEKAPGSKPAPHKLQNKKQRPASDASRKSWPNFKRS